MVPLLHPDTSLPGSHLFPHWHTVPLSTNVIFTAFQNSLETNKMTDEFAMTISKYFFTCIISSERHITVSPVSLWQFSRSCILSS